MKKSIIFVGYSCFFYSQAFAASPLCQKWSEQKELVPIDSSVIYESSGIASSIDFPGQRLYHINDSGSGATFHVSSVQDPEADLMTSLVKGASAEDIEAISVGPCLNQDLAQGKKGCVYLADIGDNSYERENLRIFITAEKEEFPALTKKKLQINVIYDKGFHNAEAFMVHPVTGDLYIITKMTDPEEENPTAKSLNAAVFMAKRDTFADSEEESKIDVEFKKIGELEVEKIFDFKKDKEFLVTDASFSPKGDRFVVMTLGGLVEIDTLALKNLKALKKDQYKVIPMEALEQQEAVTYSSDGKSIYFSSEKKEKPKKDEPTMVYELSCLK
jgi:hypothetical protein